MTSPQRDSQRSTSDPPFQRPFEAEQDVTFVSSASMRSIKSSSPMVETGIALNSTRISVAVSSLDTIPSHASKHGSDWGNRSNHEPALTPFVYADQTNGERTLIPGNELLPATKSRVKQAVEDRDDEHSTLSSWPEGDTSSPKQPRGCHLTSRDPNAYTIVGTIGRGTHGKVVLAYLNDDSFTDFTFYAMKVVPGDRSTPEIQKELAVLRIVSGDSSTGDVTVDCDALEDGHDSTGLLFLQRLYEVFYDQEYCFIVMEYHPATLSDPEIAACFRLALVNPNAPYKTSPSLPAYMLTNGPVQQSMESLEASLISTLLLAAEIVLGLRFLHAKGIIHQDMKPANIMISHGGHAVVGDFGATSRCAEASYPVENAAIGHHSLSFLPIQLQPSDYVTFTPTYAAPELRERNAEGYIEYDTRSDWWSLGVLLHELSTGAVPCVIRGNGDEVASRRSEGDLSLSFGTLEAVEKSLLRSAEEGIRRRVSDLRSFLQGLLAYQPSDRLADDNIQSHPFFDPLSYGLLWDEVAAGRHPPCPNPEVKHLVDERDCSYMLDGTDLQSDSWASHELVFHTCYDDRDSHSSLRRYGLNPSLMSSRSSSDEDQCILRGIPSTASIFPSQAQASEHRSISDQEDVFMDSGTSFSHHPSYSNAPRPTIVVSLPRPHIEEEYVLTLPDWITDYTSTSSEARTHCLPSVTLEPGPERSETPLDKIQHPCLLGSPFEESTPAAVRRRLRHQNASHPSSSLLFCDFTSSPSLGLPQLLPPPETIDWPLGYQLLSQEDNLPEVLTMVLLQAMDIRDKNASRMTAQHEERLYRLHEMVRKRQKRRPRKLKKTQRPVLSQSQSPQVYMHARKNSHTNVSAARRFWGCMRFWEDTP